MKKYFYILSFFIIFSNSFFSQNWRENSENTFPANLGGRVLKVCLFELSPIYNTQKKVDRANKELKSLFNKIYPYSFEFIKDEEPINNNLYFKSNNVHIYNQSHSIYTPVYYFVDSSKDQKYEYIHNYNSVEFLALKQILIYISKQAK